MSLWWGELKRAIFDAILKVGSSHARLLCGQLSTRYTRVSRHSQELPISNGKAELALPVLDALASEQRETLYTSFHQHIHNGRLAIKTKCPGSNIINTWPWASWLPFCWQQNRRWKAVISERVRTKIHDRSWIQALKKVSSCPQNAVNRYQGTINVLVLKFLILQTNRLQQTFEYEF